MRGKITSGALMTSLVLHVVIALVAGLYLLVQTERFRDLIGVEILYPKEPPKLKAGKFVVKPVIKPTVPTRDIVIEQIQVQPRVKTLFIRELNFQPQMVFGFSTRTVKVKPPHRSEPTESHHTESSRDDRCDTRGFVGVGCS